MKLTKIVRSRLTDTVVSQLYEKISQGELQPGEKLSSETELAEQLGVARPTIREAINQLIGLGLLVRGDYGVFVAQDPNQSVQARLQPLLLEQWKTRELYEARMVIMGELAVLAAMKATPNDIETLHRINLRMKDWCDSDESYWERDLEFHNYLAKIADNGILLAINNLLNEMFKRYETSVNQLYSIQAKTYERHDMLIKAIEQRDAEKARAAVYLALQESEEALSQLRLSRK
jgi:DNA-binding FadR family transcriptional regulator